MAFAIANEARMEIVLLCWIVFGMIGGGIGASKGRAGAGIVLGILLGPLGLLIVPALKSQKELDRKNTKKCPYCAERVAKAAQLCKHCGQGLQTFSCPHCNADLVKPLGAPPGATFSCEKCSGSVSFS